LLVAVLAAPGVADDPNERELSASRVVFRASRSLAQAFEVATFEAWRDETRQRPVAIVIDVTPFTAFARPDLEAALTALAERVGSTRETWWLGRLGDPLLYRGMGPAALLPRVGDVLARPSAVPSTIHAIQRSLRRFRADGGVVVYVADRHFEDGAGLEALLERLAKRHQRFSVVGPEAGFGLPYDDAAFLTARGPFGAELESDPWPTGDTAWPHCPGRLRVNTWYFREPQAFRVDLGERLWAYAEQARRDRATFLETLRTSEAERMLLYAVPPSSFGPYALMRLCARTGGRYCLWSWNPLAEPGPVYEYGRCNHYEPDLRARTAIRSDLVRRPLARALIRSWETLASPTVGIAAHTPPVSEGGIPRAMEQAPGNRIPNPWQSARAREDFLEGTARLLDRLDLAVDDLERTIAAAAQPDAVDRRYRADAELLLHILRLQRFSHAEMRAAWLAYEADDDGPGRDEEIRIITILTFQPQHWVSGGPSPDTLRLAKIRPYDLRAAREVLAAHRAFLERFRGTPYAELVSRNAIHTWRVVTRQRTLGGRGGSGPASSRGRKPKPAVTPGAGPTTGAGPSTGGGPVTGR
jgi:hypothetical protein